MLFGTILKRALATSAAKKYPPHIVIRMPALSPTMTKGNVGGWRKKEGDAVSVGDVLVEIETDKAQMEFECPEDGFLAKILLKEGEKEVPVSKPLAVLVDDKKVVADFKDFVMEENQTATKDQPKEAEAKEAPQTPAPAASKSEHKTESKSSGDRLKASPLAKAIAKETKIDLSKIIGSGPGGRIVKDDVLGHVNTKQTATSAAAPAQIPLEARVKYIDIPLSNMRKTIAERLSYSMQTIPHYYLTLNDLSMTMVMRARAQLNAEAANHGIKLSVNDFVIKAAAMALKAVPEVNSQWMDDKIRKFETIDVCFAVATESGLITPIVKDADKLGLLQMALKTKELAEKAKANKLKPDEFQGGTFTVSNLGMFGVSHFTAIINPPQSAILAVGATKGNDQMAVTLSCDHRVIDGATGARWLAAFRGFLEEPFKLLL